MKKFILALVIVTSVVACDTPRPATGTPESDSTNSKVYQGADSTLKRDSMPPRP